MSFSQIMIEMFYSWKKIDETIESIDSILEWIKEKKDNISVNVNKIPYSYNGFWHYDKAEMGIINSQRSFFKIVGIREFRDNKLVCEQPIYVQNEIGFLGIIAKRINGCLYFLMQAKIEPGNINKIQISPTIQATKSNFTRTHGGKEPPYLDYFLNKDKYEIVVDQIQSEQSSRFLGKRNRNVIIIVNEEVKVIESHKWMTLGQIKQLMTFDNLVNMDTRTVISCIPFTLANYTKKELMIIRDCFSNDDLFKSMFSSFHTVNEAKLLSQLNDVKMFDNSYTEICDLLSLRSWNIMNGELSSPKNDFKVVFADIEIEGREVRRWQQPLFESIGKSIFGLIYRVNNKKIEYLVKLRKEIGCFDKVEIGPTIQIGPMSKCDYDYIETLFKRKYESNSDIVFKGLFSEEGGRFYHEENINVIMSIDKNEIKKLPKNYFWVDFFVLNHLIQYNNILNIQLRNLLSIINL